MFINTCLALATITVTVSNFGTTAQAHGSFGMKNSYLSNLERIKSESIHRQSKDKPIAYHAQKINYPNKMNKVSNFNWKRDDSKFRTESSLPNHSTTVRPINYKSKSKPIPSKTISLQPLTVRLFADITDPKETLGHSPTVTREKRQAARREKHNYDVSKHHGYEGKKESTRNQAIHIAAPSNRRRQRLHVSPSVGKLRDSTSTVVDKDDEYDQKDEYYETKESHQPLASVYDGRKRHRESGDSTYHGDEYNQPMDYTYEQDERRQHMASTDDGSEHYHPMDYTYEQDEHQPMASTYEHDEQNPMASTYDHEEHNPMASSYEQDDDPIMATTYEQDEHRPMASSYDFDDRHRPMGFTFEQDERRRPMESTHNTAPRITSETRDMMDSYLFEHKPGGSSTKNFYLDSIFKNKDDGSKNKNKKKDNKKNNNKKNNGKNDKKDKNKTTVKENMKKMLDKMADAGKMVMGNLLPEQPDSMPTLQAIDVVCTKEMINVTLQFDKEFEGVIYSKGNFGVENCTYVNNEKNKDFSFTVQGEGTCGTKMVEMKDKPAFLENVLIIQNEAGIQEVWDSARSIRCMFDGKGEDKTESVMAGLNVAKIDQQVVSFSADTQATATMDIQVGRGPFASPAAGLVKIGELMTLVVTVEGPEKAGVLVRQCMASDGTANNTVVLTDMNGCVVQKKLMGSWQTTTMTGDEKKPIIAFAHFQAFKFPEKMEVQIECQVDLCSETCGVCGEDMAKTVEKMKSGRRRRWVSDFPKKILGTFSL